MVRGVRVFQPVEATHLRLIPYGPQHVLSLRNSVDDFERTTGLRIVPSLRAYMVSDEVSPEWVERVRSAPPEVNPWVHGFGVLHKEEDVVIGAAGFVGPPDAAGVVEIAYGIAPEYQGRGYATEAARALIKFAFADARVQKVIAHTFAATNASTAVLSKCGFHYMGPVEHHADGLVWRWERDRVSRVSDAQSSRADKSSR
jgi:[ribosomal protein S5]-alanine N-acetyltransferase